MSINNNVTQMIFNHIKTNFTYKYYTKEDNTDLALDSNIVTNYDIDWSLVGVLKGDRVVISDGINTFTSYVAEEPINSLVLEDNSEYAFTNASITIYFLPKLYKEYAPEQIPKAVWDRFCSLNPPFCLTLFKNSFFFFLMQAKK